MANYIDDLLDRTRRGEIDPSFVVSHVLPLGEAPRGDEIFERKLDNAIKVLLKPAAHVRIRARRARG